MAKRSMLLDWSGRGLVSRFCRLEGKDCNLQLMERNRPPWYCEGLDDRIVLFIHIYEGVVGPLMLFAFY